ncbi:MAG: SusC/RagA family TonB-linked outer membrane protein, partial [Ekhidna sp.]|nr:SusC/RagA family TonB-linked outer membrane protein [Ekhidna sp.]
SFTGSFSPFSQVLTRDQVQDIDVNWTDQALRSGMFHEFNASHSGSGEKTNYFFSLNYRDEEAVYVGSKFQRIATRANINANISDYLTGGIRLNNTVTLNDQPLLGDGFRRAMRSNLTWWPLLNSETGELNDRQGRYNIDYLLDDNYNFRRRETLRSMSSTFLELKLPFYEKVSIRSEAGLDVRHNISNSFTSFFINPEGSEANQSTLTNYSLNYNVYATFKEQLGDHSFNVVLGIERNDFEQKSSSVTGTGLDQRRDINEPGDVSIANLKQDFAGTTGSTRFDGRFGRVNYSFKDRYLFNASFRRDASSIFPEENQAGWFRAFSVGHITSDEEFWPTNFVVNFFKIRASYGEVGNHRFPNNLGQTQYVVWPRYGDRQGQSLTSIGNESLQWEDINTTEFGLEFGLLQNRISGGFSYYLMDTENAILPTPVPASYGAAPYSATNTQFANVGTLSNEGFEFELRSVNINKGGFSWNTTLNLTLNRSIVKKIALIEGVTELQVSGGRVLLREEENLGAYFLPAYAGIDEDGNELIYRVDEEGNLTDETVILATGAVAQENRVFTADRTTQPTYWGGLTNTFSYKNFTLSAFFSFQGGNYLLDTWERDVSYIGSGRNVILAEVAENRWESSFSPPTSLPAADLRSTNGLLSDRFLQKGDFIRLRSLRIGYNLPDAVLDKLKLSRAEIYILGNNLFTITDFKGLDPEALRIQSGGFVDDAIDYNLGQGIITSGSIAPQVRMFSAGISFGF